MPKSTTLSCIALSPWVSSQIISFCDSQEGDERAWYWRNVKIGVQQIVFYRSIALLAATGMSLSRTIHADEIWATGVTCVSGLALCYALFNMHTQAKKIEIAIAPYLRVTFRSVSSILQTGREAGGYGSFSESKDAHVAVDMSAGAKKDPVQAVAISRN